MTARLAFAAACGGGGGGGAGAGGSALGGVSCAYTAVAGRASASDSAASQCILMGRYLSRAVLPWNSESGPAHPEIFGGSAPEPPIPAEARKESRIASRGSAALERDSLRASE